MSIFPSLIGAGLSIGGSLLGGSSSDLPFDPNRERDRLDFGQHQGLGGRIDQTIDFNNFFQGLSTLPGIESSFGFDYDSLIDRNYDSRTGDLSSVNFPLGGRELQRVLALGEIPRLEDAYNNDIIPFADRFAEEILGSRGAGFDSVLGGFDSDIGGVSSLFDQSIGSLSNLDSTRAALASQKSALGQRTQDLTRRASETAAFNASTRGLGSSTVPLADVVNNVLPNLVGQQMQAEASYDTALADLDRQFQQSRSSAYANKANTLAGLASSRAGIGSSFAQDRTGEYLFSQLVGLRQAAPQARFGALAQPSAIFGDPTTKTELLAGVSPTQSTNPLQSLGNTFGGLGTSALFSQLFGPNGYFGQGAT